MYLKFKELEETEFGSTKTLTSPENKRKNQNQMQDQDKRIKRKHPSQHLNSFWRL